MDWIYLDNNATTAPDPAVVRKMTEMHEQLWANPSSVHRFGQRVRHEVDEARQKIASLVGARDREIILTSGGTESNNAALWGVLHPLLMSDDRSRCALLTSKVEHAAVREPAEALAKAGVHVAYVAPGPGGVISSAAVDDAIDRTIADMAADRRDDDSTSPISILISVQWANNETGTIQPIADLVASLEARRAKADRRQLQLWLHVDATQVVGKMPINVVDTPVDLMTFSAHKFHGPKGAGALYVRRGVRLDPLLRGGPQERDRRGGTENTAAIAGFGVAAELAPAFVNDAAAVQACRSRRDRFEAKLAAAIGDVVINGANGAAGRADITPGNVDRTNNALSHVALSNDGRLWNTSNLGFPRLEAEAILIGLSERGVCASAGAACSSGSLEPSPVLLAMGIPEAVAHGSVRFSISRHTTDAEIDQATTIITDVVQRLAKTLPVG